MQQIEWEDYKRADWRIGTVLGVCNFSAKHIAGMRSDVQMSGAYDADLNAALAGLDKPLPNGARLA